jgi:hypothetical protein
MQAQKSETEKKENTTHHKRNGLTVSWKSKDVAVYVFPPSLLRLLRGVVVPGVLEKIVLEHAHQDGGQEPSEQ